MIAVLFDDLLLLQSCTWNGKEVVVRMFVQFSLNVVAVGKPQSDFHRRFLRHISYGNEPGKVPSG